jgi:hypothetical protein
MHPHFCKKTPLLVVGWAACVLVGSIYSRKYMPSYDRDVYDLLSPSEIQGPPTPNQLEWTTLLICTMLTDDFPNYGAGAVRIARDVRHKDMETLKNQYGIRVSLIILEMQVSVSHLHIQKVMSYRKACPTRHLDHTSRIWMGEKDNKAKDSAKA